MDRKYETDAELLYLCRNIKYLRNVHKISKKEMASILGIGVKSLRLIEKGIVPSRLSSEVIFNLHKNFGVKYSDMFKPIE